jgi:hypothetical protein
LHVKKKLKEVLGSGEAIFIHPVLETLNKIDSEKKLNSIRGETLDEVLDNFGRDVVASNFFKKAWFEKTGPKSYKFHIEGCAFAEQVHHLLEPKDCPCPMVFVAMAIYSKKTGKKVKLTESEFTADGAITLINS